MILHYRVLIFSHSLKHKMALLAERVCSASNAILNKVLANTAKGQVQLHETKLVWGKIDGYNMD